MTLCEHCVNALFTYAASRPRVVADRPSAQGACAAKELLAQMQSNLRELNSREGQRTLYLTMLHPELQQPKFCPVFAQLSSDTDTRLVERRTSKRMMIVQRACVIGDQRLVLLKKAYLKATSLGLKVEKGKNMQLSLQHSSAPAVLHSTNEAFLATTDDAGLWQRLHQQRDLARLQNLSQVREPSISQDQSGNLTRP